MTTLATNVTFVVIYLKYGPLRSHDGYCLRAFLAVTKFFRLSALNCGECHFVIVDISHFDPISPRGPAQTLGTTFHPPRE